MINELEVKTWCQKYGFKYQYVNCYNVLIQSRYDKWRVEYDGKSGHKPLQLYHQNTRHNTEGEHKQRRFKDMPFLLRSIKQHDEHYHYMLFNRQSHIDRLFDQIIHT